VSQLTRIRTLATASAIVALSATAVPACAEEFPQGRGHPILSADDCHMQRRALSRRACQARVRDEMHTQTLSLSSP